MSNVAPDALNELFIASVLGDVEHFSVTVTPPLLIPHAVAQPPQLTPLEALTFSADAFCTALAEHIGRTYEEVADLFNALSFNLWSLAESPTGWAALSVLLTSGDGGKRFLIASVH